MILKKKAVSLLELIIVTIIIGILATLSLPLFERTRERALDEEAKANLKLIQAAQRIYAMELGFFLDCTRESSPIHCINTYLKLSLPTTIKRLWNYTVVSLSESEFIGTALRNTPNLGWLRTWSIDKDDEEPTCEGSGCP